MEWEERKREGTKRREEERNEEGRGEGILGREGREHGEKD
jgi:hypothetical protein